MQVTAGQNFSKYQSQLLNTGKTNCYSLLFFIYFNFKWFIFFNFKWFIFFSDFTFFVLISSLVFLYFFPNVLLLFKYIYVPRYIFPLLLSNNLLFDLISWSTLVFLIPTLYIKQFRYLLIFLCYWCLLKLGSFKWFEYNLIFF